MIIHTPAIVLRMVDFKESSKIVTLLTRDQGKVAVMVRGVMKPKSKFAGVIQPGNILDTVFYYKESRSVQNLTEASIERHTWKIRADVIKLAIASASLEMLGQLTHEKEENATLYEFGASLLGWLHDTDLSPLNLFPYVQMRLAFLMGVGIQAGPGCEEVIAPGAFLNIDEGNIAMQQGSGMAYRLTEGQAQYIAIALGNKKSLILKKDFSAKEIKNLIHHLDVYLKHHIEDVKDRKSDYIFDQILT